MGYGYRVGSRYVTGPIQGVSGEFQRVSEALQGSVAKLQYQSTFKSEIKIVNHLCSIFHRIDNVYVEYTDMNLVLFWQPYPTETQQLSDIW